MTEAQSYTRATPRRRPRLSKVANARESLADFGPGKETYCLTFGQRQPGYLAELVRLFGEDAIRTTRTHAKFAVITNDDWKVSIRTSMNLNENPRLESIELSDDPKLSAFLLRVVDAIFAEEAVGDFTTKRRPELPGMAGIAPQATVSMGRSVSIR